MNPQAPAPSAPRFCPTCGVSLAGQQNHGCVAPPPDEPYLRYCASCGAAFDAAAQSCPSCGLSWRRPSAYELPALAVLLTELQDWYRGRVIDRGQYVRLRDAYAAHLPARAPAAPLVAAAWPPETPTHAGGVEAPPPAPPRPPRPPRDSLGQWAAKRQADIVLYLGAFFLSVAALIFVNYQGEALGSLGRVALLAGYTAAFFAAGVAAPRWERVREAGHVFIALSAIFTPLTFLLLYTEIFRDRGLPADVVWLLGATFCFLFYGALALRGFGRWYTAPMTLALLIGWGALASVLDLPQEWAGAWYLALAAAAATLPLVRPALPPLARALLLGGAVGVGGAALVFAHGATLSDRHHAQLAVSYLLATVGVTAAARATRMLLLLPVAATAALATALSALWAIEAGGAWYPYPALLIGFLAVDSRRWWAPRNRGLATFGWIYAAALAGAPLLALTVYGRVGQAGHGAVGFALAAALLALIALRNTADGLFVAALYAGRTERSTPPEERLLFAWAAAGAAMAAVGFGQRHLGVAPPHTSWAYMALAVTAALATATPWPRTRHTLLFTLPVCLAAVIVSLQPYPHYAGHDAILLAAPAAALLVAFALTRRWTLTLASAALAAGAMAAGREVFVHPAWTLALAYAAVGLALFAGLAPLRRGNTPAERGVAVAVLSWSFNALAVVAGFAVWAPIGLAPLSWPASAHTAEHRTLAAAVAVFAPLLAFEAWRLKRTSLYLAAAAVGAFALALAWPAAGFSGWTLAATYGLIGVALFVALAPLRRGGAAAVAVLSWGYVALAPAVALLAALDQAFFLNVRVADTPEYQTLTALVFVVGALLAVEAWRRNLTELWPAVPAAVMVGLWLAWQPGRFPLWTLALTYGVAGVGLFALLGRERVDRDGGSESNARARVAGLISWAVPVVAGVTAAFALAIRAEAEPSVRISRTAEYLALTGLLALLAPLMAWDAWRLKARLLYLPASAFAMVAALLLIGVAEPDNVQAYTGPLGAYLIAVGLVVRRSPAVLPGRLAVHELAVIAGWLFVVLPAAQQSFEPGGARWGLALIAEGLLFLLAAFLLHARWLVVAGVVTLTGVGVRWLAESGDTVPYWLTLGVLGIALLAAGVLILVERDRWERFKLWASRWWQQGDEAPGMRV